MVFSPIFFSVKVKHQYIDYLDSQIVVPMLIVSTLTFNLLPLLPSSFSFLTQVFLLTTALIGIVLCSLWIQSNTRSSRHLIFRCSTCSMIRNNFYNKAKALIPIMNSVMNSSNYFINIQFMKYVSVCFDLRDKLYPN